MARPQKQGLDYFPHDVDASSDEKVEALRSLYGNDGYAFYFIMLERIYRTDNFELPVSDAETRKILSRKVGVGVDQFEVMVQSAIKFGCFDATAYRKRGVLTSDGIKERAAVVLEKRRKMREYYERKHGISDRDSDSVSAAETQPETPQSKVKKSKGKEIDIYPAELLSILTLWNEQRIVVHQKPTTEMAKGLEKAKKRFTIEQIKAAIQNYGEIIRHPDRYWFQYKWTLAEFLSRSNAIPKFVDEMCFTNLAYKRGGNDARTANREVVSQATVKSLAEKARAITGDS